MRTSTHKKAGAREPCQPPDRETETASKLQQELEALRGRLAEAEENVRAIRQGEVDALFIGEQVYLLQDAETPYRILIESINEGAATLLHDGTILYCNKRLGTLLNEPLQQLMGSSLLRFLPPADLPAFTSLVESGTRGTCKGEFLVERRGMTSLPVQFTLGPLEVAGTRAVCMVATDLTDPKRAEEARFASILASIADAVIATDSAGLITFMNRAAVALTGWKQEEAAGRPFADIVQFMSEGIGFSPQESLKAALARGEIITIPPDVLLMQKLGSAVPVDGTVAPILQASGTAVGAVFALRDVTEYRKLEADLSNALGEAREKQRTLAVLGEDLEKAVRSMEVLVANTIDSKLLLDGDGTIVCSSPRAAAALEANPQELKGVHCTSFLLEEELLGARLAFSDFLHNPGMPGTATLKLRTQNGELAWFSLRATQVSFGPGRGFLVDVERVSA